MSITTEELIREIRGEKMSELAKVELQMVFSAMGYHLRFCKLEWCQRPFVVKRPDHVYCNEQHKYEDWNKNRRGS